MVLGALACGFVLLLAISIPNLNRALNRSKQNRTMSDIRSIATAIEAYSMDHASWRPAETLSDRQLHALLEPKYISKLPAADGWTHPIRIRFPKTASDAPVGYVIWSPGRDGKRDAMWKGPTTNFDNDVVYSDGTFLQYPEGV